MATTNHTTNYNLSQYAASDPVKFLTNYNEDMLKIDQNAVPNTRKIAGVNLQDDILLSELISAGLAQGTGGAANNALALGGVGAENYPQISSGIFTPSLIGAVTPGNPTYTERRYGKYIKIGNLCYISLGFTLTSLGGLTGDVRITGLPFIGDQINHSVDISFAFNIYIEEPFVTLKAYISGENIQLVKMAKTGAANANHTNISDTFTIGALSGCYIIA